MSSETNTRLAELVSKNKVLLFMKGNKSFPQCGFSNQVVQILKKEGVEFETVNVLSDPDIRQGIKEFSNWPTIPQLYVNGKFVGGCDIVTEMHASGELDKELRSAGAK
jgi:monothiol glutaredoxin